MSRRRRETMRSLKKEEQDYLEMLSRSQAAPAVQVARAKMLLAVVAGKQYKEAAVCAGYRDGDVVSRLVKRFNNEGMSALVPRQGGRPETLYGPVERERILKEFRRQPSLENDATATWSLKTLQQALRQAEDGLPRISTHTIWKVLRLAGYRFYNDRSWCKTGVVRRKRKTGIVEVHDPLAEQKKNDRKGLSAG